MPCHFFLALIGSAAIALSGSADEPDSKPRLTPAQALAQLREGHKRFLDGKVKPKAIDDKLRAQLAKKQNPFAAVLTCADSRLPPEFIFDQGLGDLFVVRVAGNVTSPSILGSLEYAVDHLQVPLIVILGHESCGAVKSAVEDDDPDGNLGFLLREVHVGRKLPADKKKAYSEATRTNVRFHTKELVKRSPMLKDFEQSERILIASGVFDLGSGQIDWLVVPKRKSPTEKK